MTDLEAAIERNREYATSQSYTMAIGELINLYESEELDLHPEYQRAYRWNTHQKVAFIESILIGLPLPPIFVAQTHDGTWDVIDGLQRLATVFEFVGTFKDSDGRTQPSLKLHATSLLPELEGATYATDTGITAALRLAFKRARMDVIILMPKSFEDARTELFIRLNSGGTSLTAQEIRNVVLIMQASAFYDWFNGLGKEEDFLHCISLPRTELDRAGGDELLLKFMTLTKASNIELAAINDVDSYLTEKARTLAINTSQDYTERQFKNTFQLLRAAFDSNVFNAAQSNPNSLIGGFEPNIFDVVALGLGHNVHLWSEENVAELRAIIVKVKEDRVWREGDLQRRVVHGRKIFSRG